MASLLRVGDCVDVHPELRDDNQLVCTVARGSEVLGYVVVDSTVCGISRGGLRMSTNVSEAEVRGLARTMTLKCGFLRQPQGGAKAGVRFNPEAPLAERRQHLEAFGRAIAPLLINRIFIPGPDMGTNDTDIHAMLNAVGVKLNWGELRDTQSGQYTAATVFISAKRAMQHLGLTLPRCTVAIEGFGKVGNALASLLDQANVKVVAISTERGAITNPHGLNVKQLNQLAEQHGSRVVDYYPDAERISCAQLFELPVDLLCPCATHHSLHIDNAPRVLARLICPGANNPVTAEAEKILFERGLVYLPDFVANCGGILGSTMAFASIKREQIVSTMDRYLGDRVVWLLKEARLRQVSPREIAEPFARQRFEDIQRTAAHPSLRGKLVAAGVELYTRGWVPGALVAALAQPYFAKRLA
ncbi:Glu/Leu/Phe/Val family dehydrogenase [Candidatus Nitrospira neomarina]|uniref:Glu/Leu/Phe/Val dehydrogenase dimerization domain-containing protein n=1 Tax=Candidatus Nitrospira neomarina TaxID=3020899 RepID=A0AA96GHF7_9BACT|nr:Glu/Leu/Phe/Val dehydrogenase dimerization domain-containing protein [Candidatus Nitrospira neomarina]WNM61112.1 Glu/Leu/Phe/Val dehydrogenase dimerization domain-containing protein [Candidatus Nitrospira neomarina]